MIFVNFGTTALFRPAKERQKVHEFATKQPKLATTGKNFAFSLLKWTLPVVTNSNIIYGKKEMVFPFSISREQRKFQIGKWIQSPQFVPAKDFPSFVPFSNLGITIKASQFVLLILPMWGFSMEGYSNLKIGYFLF